MQNEIDTSDEVERIVRDRMMNLSGSERFIIGCQMFESARAVIIASLPKDLNPTEFKRRLYERIYGEILPF
jgi:hypothetical protein